MGMLDEFNSYLKSQVGEPYLWGGQHTKLTPQNYEKIIHSKEDGRGKYSDGTTYANASIAYCKKLFDAGASVLYAYDCSGLGVYWLYEVKHLWKADANANTMMSRCTNIDTAGPPSKGWWVFRLDSSKKRAVHIGYMVDNINVIQAEGRKYGVTNKRFRSQDWDCWGIPKVFHDDIVKPTPTPTPPSPTGPKVLVKGKSVNVRKGDNSKTKILFTAHKGDEFPYIDTAPSGWYHIDTKKGEGYITNLTRYTELEQ